MARHDTYSAHWTPDHVVLSGFLPAENVEVRYGSSMYEVGGIFHLFLGTPAGFHCLLGSGLVLYQLISERTGALIQTSQGQILCRPSDFSFALILSNSSVYLVVERSEFCFRAFLALRCPFNRLHILDPSGFEFQ